MVRAINPIRFEIVDEPMPRKVKQWAGQRIKWETRLAPLKASPGWMPRVMVAETQSQKNYWIRQAREYLREHCPLEKWEFRGGRMEDLEGGYGIWACYRGTMTPEEYDKAQIKWKQDSDQRKREKAKAKVRKQKEEALKQFQSGVIRPFPGA